MMLVGRDEVLTTLRRAVAALASGHGGAYHLVGEPGVGKTSLLAGVGADLAASRTLAVAAEIYDRTQPLALWRQLLPDRTPGEPVAITLRWLESQVRDGSLALLVDDLHWSDPDSLQVLAAVARRARDLGLLMLTSARPDGALARYEHVIDRFGVRIELGPLAPDDVRQMVEGSFHRPPGPALHTWLAQAGGNPFLVGELLDALRAHGELVTGETAVELAGSPELPATLVARLTRRTILVPGDDGLLARAIAVVATPLHADELAALLDRPLDAILSALLDLTQRGILVATADRPTFRHDLIRRVVVESTPTVVVQALNRRALAVLGADAPVHRVGGCLLAAADPERADERQRLLALGMSLPDTDPLLAADLLRLALRGLPRSDPQHLTATLRLAAALIGIGQPRNAVTLVDERLADVPRPHPIEAQRIRTVALSLTGDLRGALDPTESGLPDGGDLTHPRVRDAVAELALLRCAGGQPEQAVELLTWLRRNPGHVTPAGTAMAHSAWAWVHAIAGRFDESLGESAHGLDVLAGDDSRTAAEARPVLVRAIMLDNCGRGAEAMRLLRTGQETSASAWQRVLLQFAGTMLLYRQGQWDDALTEIEASLLAAEETDFGMAVCWPYAVGTAIAAQRDDRTTAEQYLAAAADRVTPNSLGAELLSYAGAVKQEAAGRPDKAAAILASTARAMLAAPAPGLLVNSGVETVRLNLGRDTEIARDVTEAFAQLRQQSTSPVVAAMADWCAALRDRSWQTLAAVATRLHDAGRVPQTARAWHDAALAAATAGDEPGARKLAATAFAGYDRLGAEQLHRQLRHDLREHGVAMRPRRAAARPASGWDGLTDSERRVVDLVGTGLTNSEIGERLFVSRRTVESHLARVYTKTGVRSRGELIATRRSDPIA